jgi:hypothetical protein
VAATTQEEILSSILPKVVIDKITLANSSVNKLNVTVNLTVKETLDNDLLGTWFDDINLKKYILLDVVQSTDAEVTRALSFSNDMIQLCNSTRTLKPEDKKVKALAYLTKETQIKNLKTLLDKKTTRKIISLSKDSDGDNKITKYSSYDNEDGKRIYEIPFRADFVVDTLQPQHLAYFVVASLDLQSICRDFNIDYDVMESLEENGRTYSEIVIEDSQVAGYSYVYSDEQGEIWDGPVHQSNNGVWKTGDDETASSRTLTKTTITNTKIEDFRNVPDIQKKVFDFSRLETVLSGITKIQSTDTNSSNEPKSVFSSVNREYVYLDSFNKKETVFSDMYLSRNSDGDIKFMFGLDFNSILKKNSSLSNLFNSKNKRFKDDAIKNTKLATIKILRRRIKNNIKVDSQKADYDLEKFDINEPDDLVVMSSDISWKNLNNINNKRGSLREVDIEMGQEYESIRYFTGIDKLFSEITDGLYQYGIELEIEDGTIEFVKERLNALELSKREIEQYYNEVSMPSIKKFLAENVNPHIKSPNEYSARSALVNPGYDILSNRFSRQLVDKMIRKYSRNPSSAPWVAPVAVFVDVLDLFSESVATNSERRKLIRTIFSYLNPNSGNPSSILKAVELFDYLISSIFKATGLTPDVAVGSSSTKPSSSGKSKSNFKIQKYFNSIVDSNVSKKYGLDYLSTTSRSIDSVDGLTVLSSEVLFKRVENETLKFFDKINPNLNFTNPASSLKLSGNIQQNSFSYITPTRIDLPAKSVILSKNLEILDNKVSRKRDVKKESLYDQGGQWENALSIQSEMLSGKLSTGNRFSPSVSKSTKKSKISGIADPRLNNSKEREAINKITELLSEHGSVVIEPVEIESQLQDDGTLLLRTVSKANKFSQITDDKITNKLEEIKETTSTDENKGSTGLSGFLAALSSGTVRDKKTNSGHKAKTAARNPSKVGLGSKPDFVKNILQTSPDTLSSNGANVAGFKSPMSAEKFSKIPNQIRALLVNSSDIRPEIKNSLNYTDFGNLVNSRVNNHFHYEMIMEIQYLSGFETLDGTKEPNVARPIWKTFTKQVNDSFGDGKELLCRLKSYENPDLSIDANKDAHDSAYDKYFIIKTKKMPTGRVEMPAQLPNRIFVDNIIRDIQSRLPQLDIVPSANFGKKPAAGNLPEIIQVVKINPDRTRDVIEVKNKDLMTQIAQKDLNIVRNISTTTSQIPVSSYILSETIALNGQNIGIKNSSRNNNPVASQNINNPRTKASRPPSRSIKR